jgi:hypothetical protein
VVQFTQVTVSFRASRAPHAPQFTSEVYGWVTPASDQAVTDGLEALFSDVRGLPAASGDTD